MVRIAVAPSTVSLSLDVGLASILFPPQSVS
jgi:hypothetical protein